MDIVLPWATATRAAEGEEGWEREQRFLGEAEGLTGAVLGLRKTIRMSQDHQNDTGCEVTAASRLPQQRGKPESLLSPVSPLF